VLVRTLLVGRAHAGPTPGTTVVGDNHHVRRLGSHIEPISSAEDAGACSAHADRTTHSIVKLRHLITTIPFSMQ